jgi:capsular exopolysaccharide synthesis family protein
LTKPHRLAELPLRPEAAHDDDEPPRVAEQLVSFLAPDSFEADQYRSLRHGVERLREMSGLHVLAVTSPASGDGKSVTSLNLAGALAQSPDSRVLIIDGDLRRPSVGKYLGLTAKRTLGLADLLLHPEYDLSRAVHRLERFNLSVLPAGPPQIAPYELLNSSRLDAILTEARARYSFVMVDTPPVVALPDCRLIGRGVDGFLLIVGAHKTPRKLVEEAISLLDPAKVIGVVLNGDDRPVHGQYGYYYAPRARASRADRWRRFWNGRGVDDSRYAR